MSRINWNTTSSKGYRTLSELPGDIKIEFPSYGLPQEMTEIQKKYGIFGKVWVTFPYSAPVLITLGVDKTTDERYQGFKFRKVGVSNGVEEVELSISFETLGQLFQTIHSSIVGIDGTVIEQEIYDLILQIAEEGSAKRTEFKARRKNSLKDIREAYKKGGQEIKSDNYGFSIEEAIE